MDAFERFPRYLMPLDPKHPPPQERIEILVIGGGIAGLSAAITAATQGLRVHLFSKDPFDLTNTFWAQGGVAAVMAKTDCFEGHIQDTLHAGQGLCDPEVVDQVVRQGPERIRELMTYGCKFDLTPEGQIKLGREGGHGAARILHARGDATGSEVEESLLAKARETPNLTIREGVYVTDLLTGDDGRVQGAVFLENGTLRMASAGAVILSSGGACRLFRESSNPAGATGDGQAMAFRAGAFLRDMEFVQFHPTVLYLAGVPRALITEAVRGEGAKLVDRKRRRFMPEYHPMAELAPRDVVSRAIRDEMIKNKAPAAYLDLSSFDPAALATRFPKIKALCDTYGINPKTDLIPVRPAAHYFIGGAATDTLARTSLPGLFACGEAAASGVHGANRLGSNSLLEGLVMGQIAGEGAVKFARSHPPENALRIEPNTFFPPVSFDLLDLENSVRTLAWTTLGLARNSTDLEYAIEQVSFWSRFVLGVEIRPRREEPLRRGLELKNQLTLAHMIATAALARKETRGTHFRLDYPEMGPETYHLYLRRGETEAEILEKSAVAPDWK